MSNNSGGTIQTATSGSFNSRVLDVNGPIVVEFMSYGCGHCRLLEPALEKVAAMVAPTEKVFRVNVGVEQELSDRYEIRGTPTLIMFLDGNVVGRVEGPSPVVSRLRAQMTQPFEP